MVNKCSVVGCKSLYTKENVKLHRFPLTKKTILRLWIAFTGKESSWVPGPSSRLCCRHFIESDYMMGHKKGILNPTAVPSIENRVIFQRYKKNNEKLYQMIQFKDLNEFVKVEYIMEQENDTTVQDQTASYQGNVNIKSNKYSRCVYNRKNQCSKETENFEKNLHPIIPTFEGSTNFENLPRSRNIKEQVKNIIFNDITNLKLKKPRSTQTVYLLYFNSPIIRSILS